MEENNMIRTLNSRLNLCEFCNKYSTFPICIPDDVEFGNGVGNDNITGCSNCDPSIENPITLLHTINDSK